jgi:hypothetical protein
MARRREDSPPKILFWDDISSAMLGIDLAIISINTDTALGP